MSAERLHMAALTVRCIPARYDRHRGQLQGRPLTAREYRLKQQFLTQFEPTKFERTAEAVLLKHGNVGLLTDEHGDIPWDLPHGLGLFYHDCRFLDGYTLTLNGKQPTLLSSLDALGYQTHHDLTNPRMQSLEGSYDIERHTITVRRDRVIRSGILHETVSVRNHGQHVARIEVGLRFRATFEDIFVLRGFAARPKGEVLPAQVLDEHTLVLRYRGTDGYHRSTTISFSPAPDRIVEDTARFFCYLQPGSECKIAVSITPQENIGQEPKKSRPQTSIDNVLYWLQKSEQIWLQSSAEVTTSNSLFDRVLRRSLLDLRLLRSRLDGLHYFAAGIPWFATLFGRDAATVAIQTLPYGTDMACETLQLLARYQATEFDRFRDAEPGKILHEYRTGELARTGSMPQSPAYYGTVDATLLFLILMAEYANWSGDLQLAQKLQPNMDAALYWIDNFADRDGNGYIDYSGRYGNRLVNQGWKDAGNSIVNETGSMAQPPISVCEVQAYLYRAWKQCAQLLRTLGQAGRAEELEGRATQLKARFERDFWSEELGCYVLALQENGRPARVISSNAGQVLWGGIATHEKAARVVKRLMQPDMFSGWGIRTLSTEEKAYNPISYHLGSVWPHDNGLIASGFCRYGHQEEALRILDALFEAVSNFRDNRMPELYSGHARQEGEEIPVRYPVACSPQAWAAGAIPHILWNLLGLRADAPGGRLSIVQPRLPRWLDWLEVKRLRVGNSQVTLRFERQQTGGAVQVNARVIEGSLDVVHTDELAETDNYV